MALSKEEQERIKKLWENRHKGGSTDSSNVVSSGTGTSILSDKDKDRIKQSWSKRFDVDDIFINTFISDANDFLNNAQTNYNKLDYKSATAESSLNYYKAMRETEDDLGNRAWKIQNYLKSHKNDIDEETYTSLSSFLDNFSSPKFSQQFFDARDYYSQWETEEDYNSALEAQKEYNNKLNFDVTAGQEEIDELYEYYTEFEDLRTQYVTATNHPDAYSKQQYDYIISRYNELVSQYGSVEHLESIISDKKSYMAQAKRVQEGVMLSSVTKNEDFEENSGYVSTAIDSRWGKLTSDYGMGYDDLTYEYINGDEAFRSEVKRKHTYFAGNSISATESEYEKRGLDYMKENEIAIYNYYYAKEGKEAAEKYLDNIQESLNLRKGSAMFEGMEDKTLLELAFGVAAGLDQFESGMDGLWNAITGSEEYTPPSATQVASGMVREDLKDSSIPLWYNFKEGQWEDKVLGNSLGQIAYDSTTTTANMLPSILTSTAVNLVAPGAGAVVGAGLKGVSAGAIVGAGLLGSSAGGNAYQEMINLGYDKRQARAYAALVGGSEAGLSYLLSGISSLGGNLTDKAINGLLGKIDNAFARTAIKIGTHMGSEFTEEYLQEVLNPWFQNLTLGKSYDVNLFSSEALYAGLLGALTAGVMEGVPTVIGEVNTYQKGKNLKAADISAQRLSEIGKTFSADTVAYQLAGRVNENTGAYTLGRLFNEIGATLTEQNITEITNALVEKGMDQATALKNAKALASVVEGAQLTKRQVAAIEANDVLSEVARTTLIDANTTWNQRTNSYNEAVKALADKVASTKSSKAKQAQQGAENAPTANTVDTQNENGTESHSEADEVDTSPANVKSIATIKDGQVTIKLDDNSEVNVKDADLSPDDGVRIETIASIDGISVEDANFVLNTLRTSPNASAQMDALGAREIYKYGFYGFSQEHIEKHGAFANYLAESQRQAIYEAGQKARQKQIESASPKATTKERGIYFDHGNGNVVAFKDTNKSAFSEDKRKAGVQAAIILHKLGIGGDIYFFESYRNSKGQLVYKDANGVEKKAPNGWYSPGDGSIHIDLNAGAMGQGYVLFTLAHELTHFIEQWSPKKYKILADFLIENYENGQSMDKLVLAKQAKLSAQRNKEVSYNEAYSEVIADSMEAMLADGNVLEKLIELKAKDNDLFTKMKQFFDNLLAKIRNAYKGLVPDSDEGEAVQKMTDSIEKIQQLFAEALVEASDNFQSSMESVVESNAEAVSSDEIITDGAVVTDGEGTKFSIKSMKHDIADGKMFEDLKTYCGWTQKQVNELRQNLENLVEYMTPHRDILDMNESYGMEGRRFSPYKPNSDPLYKISMDFSTLCSKRLLTQYVIENLQLRENRPMSAEEQMAIRDMLNEYRKVEKGLQVACAMCYVEAARLKSPKQIQRWLNDPAPLLRDYFGKKNKEFNDSVKEAQADFKESRGYARNAPKKDMKQADVKELNKIGPKMRAKYQLSAEEQAIIDKAKTLPNSTYLTAGNLSDLSESDPVIYDAYTAFVRTATRSKSLETDEPYYYGDSRRDNGNGIVVSDSFIEAVNRENGMRFSSWSDWRIQHLLDYITAVIDNSVRGAAMHGYTKFGDEVRVLGKTGMMFNMSGVAGTQTGLNEDGSLSFSPTESIDVNEAIQLREEFPEHAGLQCIGVSDAHIIALLRSDIIDYVIPYHVSGLNAALRRMADIYGWDDYTGTQHASIDKSIKKENAVDPEHWHEEPVFSEFFVGYDTGMSGIEAMRASAERYKQMCKDRGLTPKFNQFANEANYWKLLIDRKMINQQTGNLIRQKAVTPTFDFNTIKGVVDRYVDNYDSGLEARALNHIVENWDSIPKRIKDLKKQGGTKAKKTKKAVGTLANQTLAAQPVDNTKFSERESLTPEQQKHFDYNQKQTAVGSALKTLKGSAIKRSTKYGVGKEIGGEIYFHKDYAEDILPDEVLSQAMQLLEEEHPGFEYNCLKYNPKTGVVAFQEAPDFDSAREPVVGDYVSVNTNTGVVKTGHSNYIWHHKWNWVKNDYSGFDVAESWNWSKRWLSTLTEVSDGNGIERWNAQLDKFGLNQDGALYSDRDQEYDSKDTSIKNLASTFTKFGLKATDRVLDWGGGQYDIAKKAVEHGYPGIKIEVVDAFNRTKSHNDRILNEYAENPATVLTINNVLNVIKETSIIEDVIRESKEYLAEDCFCYINIYEGDKTGNGKATPKGWQNNQPAEWYKQFAEKYYKYVERFGEILVASDKPFDRKSVIKADKDTANAMRDKANDIKKSEPSMRDSLYSDRVLMGSLFSGGGTLEAGLVYQMLDKEFAVEYEASLAAIYADNHGKDHLFVGDVRDFDSNSKQNVFYLHASPVCKNFSPASHSGGETTTDITTAQATARVLEEQMPQVFTVENVKRYKGSEAYTIITDKLTELGYKWDVDVYKASDYGNATKRERMIIRAVKDGYLPAKPAKASSITSWGDATRDLWETDLIPSTLVKSKIEAIRNTPALKNLKLTKLDKPLMIYDTNKSKQAIFAWADELAPTLTTKCGDARIIMPDGKVYEPTPKFMGRIQGLPDNYKYPKAKTNAFKIIGNGIPTQLTKAVIGGVLDSAYEQTHDGKALYSDRTSTIYIKDGKTSDGETVNFIDLILDGKKKGETRTHKNLTRKWVGIAKDGYVYGMVRLGEPKPINKNSPEYEDSFIEGTDYDLQDNEQKYYYPILETRDFRDNPKPIEKHGNYGTFTLYQDRAEDSVSNRSLLANAFEGIAKPEELQKIQEYKDKVALINAEEKKLRELNEQIKELSFAKGPRDNDRIKALRFDANQAANRINTYDKQLLRLEATKPLQDVLDREKKKAYQKAEKRGKEALDAYREKTAKTQRALLEKWQESRKKAVESREKTAMKHKIQSIVGELNQLLLNDDKKRHVPDSLKKAVADALALVNMDTVGAEERAAKYAALIAKETDPDKIDAYTVTMENILRQGEKMGQRLKELRDAYEEIQNSDDPDIANGYDPVISGCIKELAESIGDTSLKDMSIEQLEDVYSMYKMVLTRVRDANKSLIESIKENISSRASAVIGQVRDVGGEHKDRASVLDPVRAFFWNNAKPVYAMERIGSSAFTEAYNNVRKGEDTWAKDVTEARAYYLDKSNKYGYDSWDFDKKYTFESTSGIEFELTLEQMMALYAYSKRDQAFEHLRLGGFVFDSNIETYKETVEEKDGKVKKKKSILKYKVNTADAHQLTPETLASIISTIEKEAPGAKDFVDEMQDYLSTVMGAKGNEVTMKMYGVKLFKEKFYFPLKSAKQFMFEQNEVSGEVKIKNSGFTNKTKPKANNPIILSNFMDVWANHVNDMSMYHSFVLPLEDFNRIFNYNSPKKEGVPPVSVKGTIQSAYSPAAVSYVKQLITDLNGGAMSDPRETFAKTMMSKFKKAKVFASLSVVIQQPSAIGRAFALVDPKYFRPTKDGMNHEELWSELKQYAPVAVIKEMGYFDTNMGKSTLDFIKAKEYSTFKEKAKAIFTDEGYRDEKLSRLPALADELTWCAIWNAVKRETVSTYKDLRPGSEEFLKVAGERFTEVVTKTQVYDSVLARSANMRSKSGLMSMVTSFMAEPTTSINMLEDAILKGKRGNKRYASRAFASVAVSVILNNALVALVYGARDDDDDETFAEKYMQAFVSGMLDDLNPLTYYPYLKDMWSLLQGYDIERADMSLVSDLADAMKGMVTAYTSEDGDAVGAWHDLAGTIANIGGVPMQNITRDINGTVNFFETAIEDANGRDTTWGSMGDALEDTVKNSLPVVGWFPSETKADKLYDAIISGDTAYVNRLKGSYKTEDAYHNAVRKALRENDPRIKEAAIAGYNGNPSERVRIAKLIIADGFDQDDVVAAINAEVNDMKPDEPSEPKKKGFYTASDFATEIANGDQATAYAAKEDIIATAQKNGKTEEEAKKSFVSSAKTELKKLFKAGTISEQKLIDTLVNFCDMEYDDAEKYAGGAAFEVAYPELDGVITYTQYQRWESDGQPRGVPLEMFVDVASFRDDGTSNSVKSQEEVALYISSVTSDTYLRDALWCCFYNESTLKNAPWH